MMYICTERNCGKKFVSKTGAILHYQTAEMIVIDGISYGTINEHKWETKKG